MAFSVPSRWHDAKTMSYSKVISFSIVRLEICASIYCYLISELIEANFDFMLFSDLSIKIHNHLALLRLQTWRPLI